MKQKQYDRQTLVNLSKQCEQESVQTKKVINRLRESLDEEDFAQKRHAFVTHTLDEFQHLKPHVLGAVFDYKLEDLVIQKEDVRNALAYQK